MLTKRIIPVLFIKNGWMVRCENFVNHQVLGEPKSHIKRLIEWNIDELILIDVSGNGDEFIEYHRNDYKQNPILTTEELLNLISIQTNIPVAFGGGIRSLRHIEDRILNGADKVVLNTASFENPKLISDAAKIFGNQAIICAIDYKIENDTNIVYTDSGKTMTKLHLKSYVEKLVDYGAGEIMLTNIDLDGSAKGFDIDTLKEISDHIVIPTIGCSGAGHQIHFNEALNKTNASALAAGNFFHFKENSYPILKRFLKYNLQNVRS